MMMKESAELLLIPFALRGHIAAAIEFAKLVVGRDDRLSVTVLVPNTPHVDPSLAAYVDSLMASFALYKRIKFVLVGNDNASAEASTNPLVAGSRLAESLKLPVKNYVAEMVRSSASRLAGFVVDLFFVSMADVADEFGVPIYVFWTNSAGSLSLHQNLSQLRDWNEKAMEECGDSESLNVPGFTEPVPVHALPALLFDGISASVVFKTMSGIRKTKGVVLNTSVEIEPHAINSLLSPGDLSLPVYPIGPVLNLTSSDIGSSGQDTMQWLNGQPPSSVIFLCFGSFGSFSPNQVKEIALALERTGFRFLWTLRVPPPKSQPAWTSEACEDLMAILPEGFLDRTKDVGRVIKWAPQATVLAHPAVGGFVSHCGWNSVLESLWFEVPVAAWPLYAEQQTNAFEMVTELKLSVAVKPGCRTDGYIGRLDGDEVALVSEEEIEVAMRKVMDGKSEMRKRVKERSQKCREAVKEGGSSMASLDKFVSDVFENLK